MDQSTCTGSEPLALSYARMREVWQGYADDQNLPAHWRERGLAKVAEYDKLIAEASAR